MTTRARMQTNPLFDVPQRAIIKPIVRTVSMTRVEVFVPAELLELPEDLVAAFERRFTDMDAQCETVSVYGLDLSRGLTDKEEAALNDAMFHHGVFYRILTR